MTHAVAMPDVDGYYSHGLLMLAMWGVANGFIRDVGFDPRAWFWQLLLHPLPRWLRVDLGYLILWQARS